jgi:hypothetical protein
VARTGSHPGPLRPDFSGVHIVFIVFVVRFVVGGGRGGTRERVGRRWARWGRGGEGGARGGGRAGVSVSEVVFGMIYINRHLQICAPHGAPGVCPGCPQYGPAHEACRPMLGVSQASRFHIFAVRLV